MIHKLLPISLTSLWGQSPLARYHAGDEENDDTHHDDDDDCDDDAGNCDNHFVECHGIDVEGGKNGLLVGHAWIVHVRYLGKSHILYLYAWVFNI